MRYLVATSGGIDSVVLLHMLVEEGKHELIVAHFDHGIREDSADDARFVKGLADLYGLPFVSKREELGQGASEETARARRYAFLREEAKKHEAQIVTAHHADDIVETIAINLLRGTGWRGVAVLDSADVVRPLLHFSKEEIRTYARLKQLEWVEDSTNGETNYLRNRVRRVMGSRLSPKNKEAVLEVWKRQIGLKQAIDGELARFLRDDKEYYRYFFIEIDTGVACELLRGAVVAAGGIGPTHPQAERGLLAIKTAKKGTIFELGDGTKLRFDVRTFVVETP